MKVWKIKYQKGNDVLIGYIESNEEDVQYEFYMKYGSNVDIIAISEVNE